MIHIAELETKRMRYRQRLAELGRPWSDLAINSPSTSGTLRDIQSNPPDAIQPPDPSSSATDAPIGRSGPASTASRQPSRQDPVLSRPCVILFLAANPRDTNQLRLGEECAEIHRELQLAPYRDDFSFESRWAVSVDDLMRHLQELDPTVIHFSGHGGGSAGLCLQEAGGRRQLVSPGALAMMVRVAALRARIVVLNACYTTVQADALRTTVDCIIGMDGAIGDDAARAFAVRFYGALGNRRSARNAVDSGIAALAGKELSDEQLPRCVTRDGVDAEQLVLRR
jgi:hypothetical protein